MIKGSLTTDGSRTSGPDCTLNILKYLESVQMRTKQSSLANPRVQFLIRMATEISTSSGLIANSAGHSRTLKSMRLRHLSLDDSPLEALSLSRSCLELLERGDSLSWYLGAPFRVNIIQKAVSALFESPHPQLCGTEAPGPGHPQEWDDILREFDPRRFEYHGGAVYRGHVRGHLVQLSENDWNMMQSGVPRMLVGPWPPMRHTVAPNFAFHVLSRRTQFRTLVT